MKSYFLESVASVDAATQALGTVLPGQESPWVLESSDRDAIAYFNVIDGDDDVVGPAVQADVSGRHWDKIDLVLATLEALSAHVGGHVIADE